MFFCLTAPLDLQLNLDQIRVKQVSSRSVFWVLLHSFTYTERIMDCITLYALPGATVVLSTLSSKRQRDIFNLRNMIDVRISTVRELLQPMPPSSFKRRATRIAQDIQSALDFEAFPGVLYAGGPHRCNDLGCECSGTKPPHALRVCKGCWAAFYCSKQCQKQ